MVIIPLQFLEGKTIDGELDFFVNGQLKFGIELLKQGDRTGEENARFGRGGKYELLGARDYAVVDFRSMVTGRPTSVQRQDHLITIFFSENFDAAVYYVGHGDKQSFNLSP